jgi:hypothetical protein
MKVEVIDGQVKFVPEDDAETILVQTHNKECTRCFVYDEYDECDECFFRTHKKP